MLVELRKLATKGNFGEFQKKKIPISVNDLVA
jgi:hypothetical protein